MVLFKSLITLLYTQGSHSVNKRGHDDGFILRANRKILEKKKNKTKKTMLKSSNWETVYGSINWQTDIHTIGYFSAIKRVQNVDTYNKVNESQKHAN